MLFCMGFHWVKVKGKLSKSEEAPILAIAPHSSFIDALALAVICLPSGVSREENDSIPLLGGVSALQIKVKSITIFGNKLLYLSRSSRCKL